MATKTERILSYLPSTFRALPRPTALFSIVDAFGNELLAAENTLAAVMMAHWVDHADRNAELIQDLACIASLYGLQPQGAEPVAHASTTCPPVAADETVEEFREHLKRYVRTFLEGTVTVQGIFRVTAEALALRIADEYDQMDAWWRRQHDELVSLRPRGEDAASLIFGVEAAVVAGQPARPARIVGTIDLSGGVDLPGGATLRLRVDAAAPVNIGLAGHTTLDSIKQAINQAMGATVAGDDESHLTLSSSTAGPASRVEAQEVAGDASPMLLGLLPRTYHGIEAKRAEVIGTVDLSGGVDLREERYLRLLVDGKHLAEIDCAAGAADPADVHLVEIAKAINDALGIQIASSNGGRLKLTSPTLGFGSSIAIQNPAAQGARERLLGRVESFNAGSDARSAAATGTRDLSDGLDLSERSKVRVLLDAGPPLTVDCAGADPAHTLPNEIVAAFTARLGLGVASHDGRFIRLASTTTGPSSTLAFEQLPATEDATELIFGIAPRTFRGTAAGAAKLVGTPDLSAHNDPAGNPAPGVDLGARHHIQLSIDGGPLTLVDLRTHAADPRGVTPGEVSSAINAALKSNVASHDGQHLILLSPTMGGDSRITIQRLVTRQSRRFVTRAFMTDEAAQLVFGFITRRADGAAGSRGRVTGQTDLSRGIDLRDARFLRLAIDAGPAKDIDCAGPRPRATLIDEVVDAINRAFSLEVASHDGRHLVLTSPTAGAGSRVVFEAPRATDASDTLLGLTPGSFRGSAATRVSFTGAVDLSAGIDLSGARHVKLGVDGETFEIDCANQLDPKLTSLNDIVIALNLAFSKQVAVHDGKHIILTSAKTGASSKIEFFAPAAADATTAIFGIKPPRAYHGADDRPARVAGAKDLQSETDLRVARFLRIAINGGQPENVDCAARATDPARARLDEIVASINQAFTAAQAAAAAKAEGTHLVIESTTTGITARIDLLQHSAGDARAKLMGSVLDVTKGSDPSPAVITGDVELLSPVNLAERRVIRLAVDGGRPVDVDITGANPGTTLLSEIIARVNAVFPNMASATGDDRLQLASPVRGEEARLELLPVRVLEMIEYPQTPTSHPAAGQPPRVTRHGDSFSINNEGAAEVYAKIELFAPHGTVGPQLVNRTNGHRVRLMRVIRPGERAEVWRDDDGRLRAAIIASDGARHDVPESQILAGPLGGHANGSSEVLTLPLGRSQWSYLECDGSRFNHARFDAAHFAGGRCGERAVFNVSHFAHIPPQSEEAVFAAAGEILQPMEIRFHWLQHQPGAFTVNLPADLPEKFGGRFNQARFAGTGGSVEKYDGVVTEPADDPDHMKARINAGSKLVKAEIVARVPIGFEAVTLPIRRPSLRKLSGGTESEPARIYLVESDVPGAIELSAKSAGVWGNAIGVTAQKAGPARFDVTISFQGARFESARRIVLGGEHLPVLAEESLRPGPVGVLQAKAAGVKATVSRDQADA